MLTFKEPASLNVEAVRATLRVHPDLAQFAHSEQMHLTSSRFTIGRSGHNAVVVAHPAVSLEHSMLLVPRHGAIEIEDLNSDNGTFVSGFRIQKWQLRHGDCISLGGPPDEVGGKFWFYHGALFRKRTSPQGVPTLPFHMDLEPRRSGDYWFQYQRSRYPDGPSLNVPLPHAVKLSTGRAVARELAISAAVTKAVPPTIQVYRHTRPDGDVIELICPNDMPQATHTLAACKRELDGLKQLTQEIVTPSIMLQLAGPPKEPARSRDEETVIRICHLSDGHVGAPDVAWGRDHARVHAALVRSLVKSRAPSMPAPWLCVTGDIAYSGKLQEYRIGLEMLAEIVVAAGSDRSRIRCVPGNHDVELPVARMTVSDALQRAMRSDRHFADHVLADPEARSIVLRKLGHYREFLSQLPKHPRELDWRESLGPGIALLGLSTVLASDGFDKQGPLSDGGNLVISKIQLDTLVPPTSTDSLHIMMSHHPIHWLSRWSQDELRRVLAGVPTIHLCGHEHEGSGVLTEHVGARANVLTLSAGAVHRGQNERGPHAYHEIVIKHSRDETVVGYSPRVYVGERNEFVVDRTRYPSADADGFIWLKLAAPAK